MLPMLHAKGSSSAGGTCLYACFAASLHACNIALHVLITTHHSPLTFHRACTCTSPVTDVLTAHTVAMLLISRAPARPPACTLTHTVAACHQRTWETLALSKWVSQYVALAASSCTATRHTGAAVCLVLVKGRESPLEAGCVERMSACMHVQHIQVQQLRDAADGLHAMTEV